MGYTYDPASNRLSEQIGFAETTSTFDVVNELTSQSGAVNRLLTHDENGNLTHDGTRTYGWDAADRLVSILDGMLSTEIARDGAGRMARIVEKDGAAVTSNKRFLWCGMELCEERDASGATVTKRFFGQGMQIGTAKYFCTQDHR